MKIYDLVVIGAGSGGLVAATTANRKGIKVALLEKNKIGGECTHYGCIPSKSLINSAKIYETTKHLQNYGLNGLRISGSPDFYSVMENVDKIVRSVYRKEKPSIFEKQGIDVFVNKNGAKFIDKNTVQIGNSTLKFRYAVICTGSSPKKINIRGSEGIDFLHNENFWSLRKLPKSILFVGGGIISAELGQALARFGSRVTIIARSERILKTVDREVAGVIMDVFKKEGIKTICNVEELISFKKEKDKTTLTYRQKMENSQGKLESTREKLNTISAERIIIAIGRQPNINWLDLQKAGIEWSEKGITTNQFLQTTAANIYACGDVTTPHKFTHTASHQANIVIENILQGNKKENDLHVLPWVIFTGPEIAHVGLSEKQARQEFGNNISVFRVDANIDRFITDSKEIGFLKVIFNEQNHVIGADAIGAHAGEWIQLLTLAIKNKIPAQTFADTIFAYPTYSEIVKKAFTRFLRTKE